MVIVIQGLVETVMIKHNISTASIRKRYEKIHKMAHYNMILKSDRKS